ncbi:MAG: UDP-N-acetylmuramoyl-L-alanine--D-glutamate ligase [Pseudomonadota bacterium]|nr:UDP-N-acetylmuramoyl-L-alanine--D-glutamate ligase [Pseudomonadota bacterium]MEE2820338.1 UDP-N-acetylmuramoyl-L-alanine--D-glutamate ligase [Pseudomonadota bacterium]
MSLIATSKRLIIGAGPTGQAVARHFQELGIHFEIADTRQSDALKQDFNAQFPGVTTYFGPLKADYLNRFEEIVVSPGVPPTTDDLNQTSAHLISDIQLFRRAWPENQPLIAITGSNAKSTVTSLVAEILKAAGRHVLVGGNLGPQALDLLAKRTDESVAVLELSSFQLERTRRLKATVATCLNMSPDHLDWHGSMIAYHRAKHRIFEGVGAIVVNSDDPLSQPLVPDQMPTIKFALQHPDFHQFGVMVVDGDEWISLGAEPWMAVSDLPMSGRCMIQNAMASFGICHLVGVDKAIAVAAIRECASLPHRMIELVPVNHVRFINDSKGTNVGASATAVSSIEADGHLYLLAGGQSKDADLTAWAKTVRAYCHQVFAFGRDRQRFIDVLGDQATAVETLDEAFALAVKQAVSGDVVMLSPACASFDQFQNYQARGEYFERLVEAHREV